MDISHDKKRTAVIVRAPSPQATEYPMSVREAAHFLGVGAQPVYLWVERKQIPHLRVMGRNIRFLKSDLYAIERRRRRRRMGDAALAAGRCEGVQEARGSAEIESHTVFAEKAKRT
jgi:excisionase family DNA binding protein